MNTQAKFPARRVRDNIRGNPDMKYADTFRVFFPFAPILKQLFLSIFDDVPVRACSFNSRQAMRPPAAPIGHRNYRPARDPKKKKEKKKNTPPLPSSPPPPTRTHPT